MTPDGLTTRVMAAPTPVTHIAGSRAELQPVTRQQLVLVVVVRTLLLIHQLFNIPGPAPLAQDAVPAVGKQAPAEVCLEVT
jgi:hypothetical protein